jgi:uncharacterized protein (TIGR02246 family)
MVAASIPILLVSLTGGVLLAVAACEPPPSENALDPTAVEAELRQLEGAHRAAIDARDIEGVLQFYAPDLITVSPDKPILRGREWIRATCEELFRNYDFHEDFTLVDIRVLGDRVAASYEYTQEMTPVCGGERVLQGGKGIAIQKRSESGIWQFEWKACTVDAAPPGGEG